MISLRPHFGQDEQAVVEMTYMMSVNWATLLLEREGTTESERLVSRRAADDQRSVDSRSVEVHDEWYTGSIVLVVGGGDGG